MFKRNSATAGLVALATVASTLGGCATSGHNSRREYATNVKSDLRETGFSDKDTDYAYSVVDMGTGDYTWGKIPEGAIITAKYNSELPRSGLFPFFAVRTNELAQTIYPDSKSVVFGGEDGTVRVFYLNPDSARDYFNTNRGFTSQELPDGEFVGRLREPTFNVPGIDFNLPGYENIPFVIENMAGEDRIALVDNASYRLNSATGLVELHGDIYAEVPNAKITIPIVTAPQEPTEVDKMADWILKAERVHIDSDSNK